MWTGAPREIVGLQLSIRLGEVHDLVDTIWSRLTTDQVLAMTLPTETLRLGRDIPPRDPALPSTRGRFATPTGGSTLTLLQG